MSLRCCSIAFLTVLALYIIYVIGHPVPLTNTPNTASTESLIANKFMPGETLSAQDVSNTDTSMRLLQYHDYMRTLEFDAEKEIAGCNSPPPVMSLMYGAGM